MDKNLLKNNQAFTLVEILVATFVFSLMVFAVAAIYLAFNNSQIRTAASQQLLNDTQYAMEVMAREIRNNEIINYPSSSIDCNTLINTGGTDVFDGCIILERSNSQTLAFVRHNSGVGGDGNYRLYYLLLDCDAFYTSCDPIDLSSGAASSILSPEINSINLADLDFYILPNNNPYNIDSSDSQQPRVTIRMHTVYNSPNEVENIDDVFQTTISSRVYKR